MKESSPCWSFVITSSATLTAARTRPSVCRFARPAPGSQRHLTNLILRAVLKAAGSASTLAPHRQSMPSSRRATSSWSRRKSRRGVSGLITSSPLECAATALLDGIFLEFPRGLGQFQPSFVHKVGLRILLFWHKSASRPRHTRKKGKEEILLDPSLTRDQNAQPIGSSPQSVL